MKYFLYVIQDAEGCDYSIACGECLIELNALNKNDAEKEVMKKIEESFFHEDSMLRSATLYEVQNLVELNMDDVYKNIKNKKLKEKAKILKEKEEKEFERLKKKLGK
jgi:CRISPR/Cas system CSM-associated protein Csm2 small subunit